MDIFCKMINVIMESNVLNFVKWQGEHRVLVIHPGSLSVFWDMQVICSECASYESLAS